MLTFVDRAGSPHRSRRLGRLAIVLLGIALAVAAFNAARADAECGIPGCLPGRGYYGDRYWNCGVLNPNEGCYMGNAGYGVRNPGSALLAGWGWGSADYDGGGNSDVCIDANSPGGPLWFWNCATNLARACFNVNCDDQDDYTNIFERVYSRYDRHTIYGHGMY
jgi:hypothetical protein